VSGSLLIRNRQRCVAVNTRSLRRLARALLQEELGRNEFDLAIHLVNAQEITRLNETHLRHAGLTDVITFDYAEKTKRTSVPELHGEIFVCLDEAVTQARRFRTTWKSELARYVIHGVLHLLGYDDAKAGARRKMKREEDRLLKCLDARREIEKL
jgi:probable rRNA maturation factor